MAEKKTGYSVKPLYQKLGIKETHKVICFDEPEAYLEWLEIPFTIQKPDSGELVDVIHIFAREKLRLLDYLKESYPLIQQNGMIWVSWPKKTSKVHTDITEDTIRELSFPLGLVDIKVCSVSNIWSGLKLMIRRENRKS